MIKLQVEEYCHDCPYFEPETSMIGITQGYSDKIIYETYVYCKKDKTCKELYKYIKKELIK